MKKRTLLIVLMVLVFSVALIFVKSLESGGTGGDIEYYAHRGYSGKYPENTLEAFEGAMDAGFLGIEVDVYETKSGDLLVFHDSTTDRMCEVEDSIYNVSTENREKYPIVSGKGIDNYGSLLIPTLEETLSVMEKRNGSLFLNLKGLDHITDQGIGKIDELLRKYHMVDKTTVFCGKISFLKKFAKKGLNVGVYMSHKSNKPVMTYVDRCIEKNIKTFIVYHPDMVDKEVVKKCHENGMQIGVYDVQKKRKAARLKKLNVDFVFSNYALFE